jgi:hypothetical protein
MTPQDIINWLDDPEKLMRRCYLSIAGGAGNTGPNGQATLSTFSVEVDTAVTMSGFTTGLSGLVGKEKDRPTVRIRRLRNLQNPLQADQFNAYYIPMVQVADVNAGYSHYTLPTVGPNTVAITSQITACVFSIGSDANGAVLVSHIQPPATPGASVTARQTAAIAAGGTGFVAGVKQVRHGYEYDMDKDRVAIIGRLKSPTWDFYMQKATFGSDAWSVRSAAKIV